jgi:hypothetical protein
VACLAESHRDFSLFLADDWQVAAMYAFRGVWGCARAYPGFVISNSGLRAHSPLQALKIGIIKNREILRTSTSILLLPSSRQNWHHGSRQPTNSRVKAASSQMGDAQKFPIANEDVGLKMFDDDGALASVIMKRENEDLSGS